MSGERAMDSVKTVGREPDIDDLIERLLDAQQDINLAANTHMSQPLCDASALIDEVESVLRRFAAASPAGAEVVALRSAAIRAVYVFADVAAREKDPHNRSPAYARADQTAIDAIARLAAAATPSTDAVRRQAREEAEASVAAQDVLAERRRQVEAEGWTPEHDDQHDKGEMADAAACYALMREQPPSKSKYVPPLRNWPWSLEWWKPGSRRRNLVKAAALIIAEIERLDRLSTPPAGAAALNEGEEP